MKKYDQNILIGGAFMFVGVFFAGLITVLSLFFSNSAESQMGVPYAILIGIISMFVGVVLLEKHVTKRIGYIFVHLPALLVNLVALYFSWYTWSLYDYIHPILLISVILIVLFEIRAVWRIKKVKTFLKKGSKHSMTGMIFGFVSVIAGILLLIYLISNIEALSPSYAENMIITITIPGLLIFGGVNAILTSRKKK